MSVFGCHFCVSGQQMPVIADIRCNWQEPWQQYSGNTSTLMMFSCYSLCEVTQFWLGLNGFVSLSRHYWVCIGPLLGMRFLPVSSSIICISCLLLFFLITSEIFSWEVVLCVFCRHTAWFVPVHPYFIPDLDCRQCHCHLLATSPFPSIELFTQHNSCGRFFLCVKLVPYRSASLCQRQCEFMTLILLLTVNLFKLLAIVTMNYS